MEKGWDAAEVIRALLADRGWTQEELAGKAGLNRNIVNAYASRNPETHRRLGVRNAHKLARAFGVSVLELGAPAEEADQSGMLLLRRLEQVEGQLAELRQSVDRLTRHVRAGERSQRAAAARPRAQ